MAEYRRSSDGFKDIFSALLNGRYVPWPKDMDLVEFSDIVSQNKLEPLIYHFLKESNSWKDWPKPLCDTIEKEAKRQFLIDEQNKYHIIELVENLATQRIKTLLFKGSALSYLSYPKSGLRPRCDTDILIRKEDILKTHKILLDLGYDRYNMIGGELISYQCAYLKTDRIGLTHTFDVHWRLSNPQFFSSLFTFEELYAHAVGAPNLSPKVKALNSQHAVLISCIHRVAHHFNDENLLWLYDIHLLANGKDFDWFQKLLNTAKEKQVLEILYLGLEMAQKWFGTELKSDFMIDLKQAFKDKKEFSALYLNPKRKWISDIYYDFRYLPNWRQRFQFVKEHTFPSKEYMLQKYSTSSGFLLPALYSFRFFGGLTKIWSRLKP